ncbi:MAG: PAS domain S-box protein [Ignavibacteriae bacterium]|nr:PAS domain S-box protein [Ignavibacteriota bacterium]
MKQSNKSLLRILPVTLLVLVLFPVQLVFGQIENLSDEWRWVHFTSVYGLPSENVISIVETKSGTIWALTSNGVVWYDGYQWILAEEKELPSSKPTWLGDWIADSIALGFESGVYIGVQHQFRKLPNYISAPVFPFNEREILFLEKNSVVKHDGSVKTAVDELLTSNKTMNVWKTNAQQIWLNTSSSLSRWNGEQFETVIADSTELIRVNILKENIHRTGIASVVSPMEMRGIWEWDSTSVPVLNVSEKGSQVLCLDVAPNGDAIAVYASGEVRVRKQGVWSSPEHVPRFLQECKFLRFASNGDLWVATSKGLYLLKRSVALWSNITHKELTLRNNVNEILFARDGTLWLGTGDGVEIHRNDSTVEWISEIEGKHLYGVTGLAQDVFGNIWISSGTTFSGAYRWDGTRWQHFDIGEHPEENRFHKIRTSFDGTLWFLGLASRGTASGIVQPGVFRFMNDEFISFGDSTNVYRNRVYAFAEGHDGAKWFGTVTGIYRFRNQTWTHWGIEEGLKIARTFTLAIDDENILWFGDQDAGGGLGYIDEEDNVHYFTTTDGLIHNQVWDLVVDTLGILWVATEGGLCSYTNGTWTTYGEKTGLSCLSLWTILPRENQVYVATRGKGLAILHRGATAASFPRVVIERPLIDGGNVQIRWSVFAFMGELSAEEIQTRYRFENQTWSAWTTERVFHLEHLQPGTYSLSVQAKGLFGQVDLSGKTISFTIPPPMIQQPLFYLPIGGLALAFVILAFTYFIRKRKADAELRRSEEKFRTVTETTPVAIFIFDETKTLFLNPAAEKLTGSSSSNLMQMKLIELFSETSREAFLAESKLLDESSNRTRNLEVQLQAQSNGERWVEFTLGRIVFEGNPAILAVAFDVTERKNAEAKLVSLASELSGTEERERQRMATYLHDYISQNLVFCKLKLHGLQQVISDEQFLQQVREVQALVEQLIRDSQTLTFELSSPLLHELGLEAGLEWLAEQIEQRHGVKCSFEASQRTIQLEHESVVLLFTIARELLMNVTKHAQATSARIALLYQPNKVLLSVNDDGKGFNVEMLGSRISKQGGFGLFNIKERLVYVGGSLNIVSKQERGTTVTVTLPMKKKE